LALKEWEKMILRGSRDYDGFDRALSAFDMFVIEDNEGDSDEVSTKVVYASYCSLIES
jgi:hypothetical protein